MVKTHRPTVALGVLLALLLLVPTGASAKARPKTKSWTAGGVRIDYRPEWTVAEDNPSGPRQTLTLKRKAGGTTIIVVLMVQPNAPADPAFDKEPEHTAFSFAYAFARAAAKNIKGEGAFGAFGQITLGGTSIPSYHLFMPAAQVMPEGVISVEVGARRMGKAVVLGAVATFGTFGKANTQPEYLLGMREAYRMLHGLKGK